MLGQSEGQSDLVRGSNRGQIKSGAEGLKVKKRAGWRLRRR